MTSAISRIYATTCEKQGRNFNTVPEEIKEEVKAIIINDGYIINEDGTVVKG